MSIKNFYLAAHFFALFIPYAADCQGTSPEADYCLGKLKLGMSFDTLVKQMDLHGPFWSTTSESTDSVSFYYTFDGTDIKNREFTSFCGITINRECRLYRRCNKLYRIQLNYVIEKEIDSDIVINFLFNRYGFKDLYYLDSGIRSWETKNVTLTYYSGTSSNIDLIDRYLEQASRDCLSTDSIELATIKNKSLIYHTYAFLDKYKNEVVINDKNVVLVSESKVNELKSLFQQLELKYQSFKPKLTSTELKYYDEIYNTLKSSLSVSFSDEHKVKARVVWLYLAHKKFKRYISLEKNIEARDEGIITLEEFNNNKSRIMNK